MIQKVTINLQSVIAGIGLGATLAVVVGHLMGDE